MIGTDYLQAVLDQAMAARNELQRRLDEILIITAGREDIDNQGIPNTWMRIGQIARGEDKP